MFNNTVASHVFKSILLLHSFVSFKSLSHYFLGGSVVRLFLLFIALSQLPITSAYGKELKFAVVPKFYSIFLIKAKMAV